MFIWNNIDYGKNSEQCNLARGAPHCLWNKRFGVKIKNFDVICKLKDHTVELKLSDLPNCETCHLNKSRKLPEQKDSRTRASDLLETVQTEDLGLIRPEVVVDHRYAIGFVNSFNRFFLELKV